MNYLFYPLLTLGVYLALPLLVVGLLIRTAWRRGRTLPRNAPRPDRTARLLETAVLAALGGASDAAEITQAAIELGHPVIADYVLDQAAKDITAAAANADMYVPALLSYIESINADAAERIVKNAGVPFTILRATQFHALLDRMFGDGLLRFPIGVVPGSFKFQTIDTGEVADRMLELVEAGPSGRAADIGGPAD